ncbi:SirB2 family protein [Acinetobacter gerneri]|uniref:Invasion protein expression up-regulator SirB n=1 Tax=Acinetobacter gerneri DSM 14967 = CIP 107464 = MTCC 9824 TaxID=1120926 RepID=N8YDN0_9GAMM|nr:SirB2 family protein [Acinetobacter gerneri]ENV34716.1 hypothetical protein F960_01022 [Acinetobacter gerneri DSM 14967 = CIP 107464 = MTCC 9824]EPR84879.1 hypothetical protein L289_0934 [Acinetobacter gerneri DSM 14967 = CIP 107464 = MTCC 9824]
MDQHALLIGLHIFAVLLLLIVLILRAMTLFKGIEDDQPNQNKRKLYVAVQHSALTILVVTGGILLYMKHFKVENWFYAKIILFLVLLSSLIKAYKKDNNILMVQRRAGLTLAFIAYIAIIGLVQIKPVFG